MNVCLHDVAGCMCAGHRSCAMQSLPLRRGMMHFAYSRQLPVQVVMTANKEAVISEKDLSAHFGQTLLVGYSKTIHAKVGLKLFCYSLFCQ